MPQDSDENGHGHNPRDYEHFVSSTEAERRVVAGAKLAVNDALNELFADMGVNRANFQEVEQFREDLKFVKNIRKSKTIYRDLEFLAGLRSGSIKVGGKILMTIIVIVVGAACYGMWDTIARALGHPVIK